MLNSCYNSRDRALMSLLYETGARIGEISSMRIKDVFFDEYGARVWFPLQDTSVKKHKRGVRVVFSSSYLAEWLNDHPLKEDPDAPLWIKMTGKDRLKPINYDDIRRQLKRIAERAGVGKRIYPHLFRHTKATRLLSRMSETLTSKYLGWVLGSKMVKVYAHLADEDVDNAILEMHGIRQKEGSVDLEVRQCPRCTFVNPAENRFCSRCGLPLTQEAFQEVEEYEKRKMEVVKLLSNPEILNMILAMQKEIEGLKRMIDKRDIE